MKWNCPRCYSLKTGFIETANTMHTFPSLNRGRSYYFTVHAVTVFGSGEDFTIAVNIAVAFGQVRNLRKTDGNDTVTFLWDPPLNVEKKDIQVIQFCHQSVFYCNGLV